MAPPPGRGASGFVADFLAHPLDELTHLRARSRVLRMDGIEGAREALLAPEQRDQPLVLEHLPGERHAPERDALPLQHVLYDLVSVSVPLLPAVTRVVPYQR